MHILREKSVIKFQLCYIHSYLLKLTFEVLMWQCKHMNIYVIYIQYGSYLWYVKKLNCLNKGRSLDMWDLFFVCFCFFFSLFKFQTLILFSSPIAFGVHLLKLQGLRFSCETQKWPKSELLSDKLTRPSLIGKVP